MLLQEYLSKENQKIINRYGLDEQLLQLMEECGELLQAVSKYRRKKQSGEKAEFNQTIQDLKLEMTDVLILFDQIKERLGMTDEELHMMAEYKIRRQIGRMSRG